MRLEYFSIIFPKSQVVFYTFSCVFSIILLYYGKNNPKNQREVCPRKTRTWILLIAALLALCLGASFLLLSPGEASDLARITSEGKVLRTVDLRVDQTFTVTTNTGSNTVTVKNGKIAVTAATCPDHYCMERGFCNSGAQIVCLPNKLVISFLGRQEIDAVVG